MRPSHIVIVSVRDDLHALVIQKRLQSYDDIACHVVESNRICVDSTLAWSNVKQGNRGCRISTRDGNEIDVSAVDVIWWRRVSRLQSIPPYISDPAHIDLINNDCGAALLGLLLNAFRGTWISDPGNSRLAANKLVQLRAAEQAGFRVPRTLVTQDPVAVRQFCSMLGNRVVVKAVQGTRQAALMTTMLAEGHVASEDSIRLAPAIYQEYVPGERHVRAHCFGDRIYGVLIESQDLDWRSRLDVQCSVIELGARVKTRLRTTMRLLGLRMGIVDLKLTSAGEAVWLEVNPQGQFLFAEPLSGLDLTSAFAAFLRREARRAADRTKTAANLRKFRPRQPLLRT